MALVGGTEPLYHWEPILHELLSRHGLRPLDGRTLYLSSDHAGSVKRSDYLALSVLALDMDGCSEGLRRMMEVRNRLMGDGRRLSYKRLGDSIRAKALVPFLSAANFLHGALVTFLLHKTLVNLAGGEELLPRMKTGGMLVGSWKPHVFQQMVNTTFLVSIVLSHLTKPGTNVFWVSDEDQILSNPQISRDTGRVLSSFTSHLIRHPLGELGLGTTAIGGRDLFEEDMAAIPDLVSGAIADVVTSYSRSAGGAMVPRLLFEIPETVPEKAHTVVAWLGQLPGNLAHPVVVFDPLKNGVRVWTLEVEK